MDGKMGLEYLRLNQAKTSARFQAKSYGDGVEVSVQSRRTRWTFVVEGDDVIETKTMGWDERVIIPAEVVAL